ncbi:protein of unknown function [Xenorhabdus poinarii G6]|uniref:Short-chain dehydrogenase/reductase SDR n=1 Tax=Xenorhabdus poinarii G6 TaxID=1354304 RepID=A0A068R3U5_9GAMM|nr:hypothetical protein [Xenorhabdus poinarii]CDG21596.1 protein of unknown function [Xenorhabdus poinarii G6]
MSSLAGKVVLITGGHRSTGAAIVADVSDVTQVISAVKQTANVFGRLDI